MPLTVLHQNIVDMNVDAIVNAANPNLLKGGGVCGAIFNAAGMNELHEACQKLAPVQTGQAVITAGFELSSKYIIHAVGPIYTDGLHNEKQLLSDAYTNSMRLAIENNCESMAFPLLSSGIYGYPKAEALSIATDSIKSFIETHELDVYLMIYDLNTFEVDKELLNQINEYLQFNYEEEALELKQVLYRESQSSAAFFYEEDKASSLEKEDEPWLSHLDESFSQSLLKLIDLKGKTDIEVYKKANLDRKLFSKIRSDKSYMPSKTTALALAIALELSFEETNDLLRCAGFTLSNSQKLDVIVTYFIKHKDYDIYKINTVLFSYDLKTLGY
jgi:O-acetyl-ADP-ribose deacetylase (regulator of RNase III)